MDAPCSIRPIEPADAARVAELERLCFADPWSEQSIKEVIGLSIGFGLVVECRGEVVGYLLARWVTDTAEILNLAIEPGHRRRGLAGRLLEQATADLGRWGVREVFLEVRQSNQPAQALYQAHGFRVAGMRRAYYRRPKEDALVLRRTLSGSA